MVNVESKRCSRCYEVKSLDQYSLAPRGKLGRKASCKACDAARFKANHVPAVVDEDAKRERYTKYQIGTKTCTNCGVEKERSEFSQSKPGKYGPVLMSACKACAAARARKWAEDNRERSRETSRRTKMLTNYGITVEEYDARSAAQGDVCACCGKPEERYRLSVDHCHETGRIRGLLCNTCNRGIGLLGDNVEALRKAVDYLERN